MRNRATDALMPDGEEIRRRRLDLAMTQQRFIDEVLKTRWDVRMLRKLEDGRKPCSRATLEIVAKALTAYGGRKARCSVADLSRGPQQFRLAMLGEVTASLQRGAAPAAGTIERVMHALQRATDARAIELNLLLALAVRRDVFGDARGAIAMARPLLNDAGASAAVRLRVLVRLASFYDHVGKPSRGIALLKPTIKNLPTPAERLDEEWWALFQYGTLQAHRGENKIASDALNDVQSDARLRAHRIAASHQLGVIALKQGRLDEAEETFQRCLKERTARGRDDFRAAYEHNRLSEVFERRGNFERAQSHLRDARRIANTFQFRRYESLLPALRKASAKRRTH